MGPSTQPRSASEATSQAASPRLAQQALPALAGLEFVAEDIASHDGSLSSCRRNFARGRRRSRRSSLDHRGFRLVEPSREAEGPGLLGSLLWRFSRRRGGDFIRSARRNENRLGRLECLAGSHAVRRMRFGCRRSRLSPRFQGFGGLLYSRRSPSRRLRSFPGTGFRVLAKRKTSRIVDDETRKNPSLWSGRSRIGERWLRLPRLEYRVRGALRVPIECRSDWRGLEQSPVRGRIGRTPRLPPDLDRKRWSIAFQLCPQWPPAAPPTQLPADDLAGQSGGKQYPAIIN
jgi:hypothetical protein